MSPASAICRPHSRLSWHTRGWFGEQLVYYHIVLAASLDTLVTHGKEVRTNL